MKLGSTGVPKMAYKKGIGVSCETVSGSWHKVGGGGGEWGGWRAPFVSTPSAAFMFSWGGAVGADGGWVLKSGR